MKIPYWIVTLILTLSPLIACSGSETVSVDKPDYAAWITNDSLPAGDATRGEQLFNAPVAGAQSAPGCKSCHAPHAGQNIVGPSQIGMATLAAESLQHPDYNGQAQSVEGYLWESVINPNVHLVEGYAGVMYANYGEKLSEQELADLVTFMKTLE